MYREMELIQQEESVALCRIYVDGVDTGGKSRKKAHQVYAFLWSPLGQAHSVSARRLITVVLGERCCKSCGCRGRCTRQAIWKVCVWSWSALRSGLHPAVGPFGERLPTHLASKANHPLNCKGLIAHMGSDWEAFSDVLGARRWNHLLHPCCFCATSLHNMHDYSREPVALTKQDWMDAKTMSQVTVRLHGDLANQIQSKLAADHREQGSRGRSLTADVGNHPKCYTWPYQESCPSLGLHCMDMIALLTMIAVIILIMTGAQQQSDPISDHN